MHQKVYEIIEVHDFDRYRAEADAVLEHAAPKRLVVEPRMIDALNGQKLFDDMRAVMVAGKPAYWIIDLSAVRFMDSAAVAALVALVRNPEIGAGITLEGVGEDLKARWASVFGPGGIAGSRSIKEAGA